MEKLSYKELEKQTLNYGKNIFGDEEKFDKWLSHNSIHLGDKPVNLMKTYDGLNIVLDELMNYH